MVRGKKGTGMPVDSAKVLVVDDSQSSADVTRNMLVEADFIAHSSYNAEDAMGWMKETQYDLLIFDINLPGISGITLAKQAKSDLGIDAPVLFISGDLDPDTRATIRRLGSGVGFLKKPFNREELVDAATGLIHKNAIFVQMHQGFTKLTEKIDALGATVPKAMIDHCAARSAEVEKAVAQAAKIAAKEAAKDAGQDAAKAAASVVVKSALAPTALWRRMFALDSVITYLLGAILAGLAWYANDMWAKAEAAHKLSTSVKQSHDEVVLPTVKRLDERLGDLPSKIEAQGMQLKRVGATLKLLVDRVGVPASAIVTN